jgi:hypothetical protein
MLGGSEYWVREGRPVEGTDQDAIAGAVDPYGGREDQERRELPVLN